MLGTHRTTGASVYFLHTVLGVERSSLRVQRAVKRDVECRGATAAFILIPPLSLNRRNSMFAKREIVASLI
jgi:hypothetical protein